MLLPTTLPTATSECLPNRRDHARRKFRQRRPHCYQGQADDRLRDAQEQRDLSGADDQQSRTDDERGETAGKVTDADP